MNHSGSQNQRDKNIGGTKGLASVSLNLKVYFAHCLQILTAVKGAKKMDLQAEDLAFDSGITCDMCSESVKYGEDYVAHLNIVHNIQKNFNFFLKKAREGDDFDIHKNLEAIKGEQKREADVIRKNFRGLSQKRVHQLPQRTIINSNSRLRRHLNHRSLNAYKQRKARRRKTILSLPLYLLTKKDVGKISVFSPAQTRHS